MKITLGSRGFEIQNAFLNLGNKGVTHDELKALCEFLKTDNTITILNLSNNQIGPEGVKMIAEALKVNKTLISLDLLLSSIGDEGVNVLNEGVIKNFTVIVCNYSSKSQEAEQCLEARYEIFRALVRNLASNVPYVAPILANQFLWLKNHGEELHGEVQDENTISYQDFESKWQAILEEKTFPRFLNCLYVLRPHGFKYQHDASTARPVVFSIYENDITTTVYLPIEIIKHIFSFIDISHKINQVLAI